MSEFFTFVREVLSLEFALLGGCVLLVLVSLVEKFWLKHEVTLKTYARIIFALTFFACFQAWQSEYQGRIGRERDLHTQEGVSAKLQTEKDQCARNLQDSILALERLRGRAEGQTGQIQDQQSTVNSCLVQLGSLQQPVRITGISLKDQPRPSGIPNESKEFRFIILTNQTITPVRKTVRCDADIDKLDVLVLGGMTMYTQPLKRGNRIYTIDISSPAWTPTTPLLMNVYSRGPIASCGIADN